MGDATRDDNLGRDATRGVPGYRRPSPTGIRYASSGVVRPRRAATGAIGGRGAPYGTEAYGAEAYGRGEDSSGGRVLGADQVPGTDRASGPYRAPDDGSGWPGDRPGGAWSAAGPEPGPGPEPGSGSELGPEPEFDPEPELGWFGKRHPDLWVFGGSAIVAAAAMITAFAAASGATAMGYAQAPQGTATHAPAGATPVARAGSAPAFGPACITPASPGDGH
jgi:hypothetical protein